MWLLSPSTSPWAASPHEIKLRYCRAKSDGSLRRASRRPRRRRMEPSPGVQHGRPRRRSRLVPHARSSATLGDCPRAGPCFPPERDSTTRGELSRSMTSRQPQLCSTTLRRQGAAGCSRVQQGGGARLQTRSAGSSERRSRAGLRAASSRSASRPAPPLRPSLSQTNDSPSVPASSAPSAAVTAAALVRARRRPGFVLLRGSVYVPGSECIRTATTPNVLDAFCTMYDPDGSLVTSRPETNSSDEGNGTAKEKECADERHGQEAEGAGCGRLKRTGGCCKKVCSGRKYIDVT